MEDPEDLPNAINDLIGKTFKFGVYVNKENVDYGADIYNIGKTWSPDEIILKTENYNDEDSHANALSSEMTSGQV